MSSQEQVSAFQALSLLTTGEERGGSKKNMSRVDPFDFDDTYSQEFALFSQYFNDLELYLRTAIWILYREEYLKTAGDKDKLDQELQEAPDQKLFLEKITDAFETKELLMRWYEHFNPTNATEEFIDKTIQKYAYWEDALFGRLYCKYVDPDYDPLTPLWFSPESRSFVPVTGLTPEEEAAIKAEEEFLAKIPLRQGLLEQIQEGAQTARRINVQATFQPKTVLLPAPTLPRGRAQVVTSSPSTTIPAPSPRQVEMSRPGTRVTGLASPRYSGAGQIDPTLLNMTRDSYTVDELKKFLSELGLRRTGNKADLIARLKEALNLS
jgi:hypothetical protein